MNSISLVSTPSALIPAGGALRRASPLVFVLAVSALSCLWASAPGSAPQPNPQPFAAAESHEAATRTARAAEPIAGRARAGDAATHSLLARADATARPITRGAAL